jgi:hypothetical protein
LLWGSVITEVIFGHDCLSERLIEFTDNKGHLFLFDCHKKEENSMVSDSLVFSVVYLSIYPSVVVFCANWKFKQGILIHFSNEYMISRIWDNT